MGGEFRDGRPEAAPERKHDERMLGEGMDWGFTDGPRHELAEMDADSEQIMQREADAPAWGEEEHDERAEQWIGEPLRDRL